MSARQKSKLMIVGNWKMHLNTMQASILLHRLHERIRIRRDIEVVLAPSLLHLQPLSLQIDRRKFRLAAQNGFHKDEGPYTGEVSFTMLQGLVHYGIIGHSDRRYKFNETLDDVRDKVAAAVRNDVMPILCIGERKEEKLHGETMRVIHDQLVSAISELTAREVACMVIAYEPVWALSSGGNFLTHENAKPDDVQKVAARIRETVRELYGPKASRNVRILYGGSTNSTNARGYLDLPDIDGLLVGGASLNYHEFSGITEAAYRSLYHLDMEAK